jgi:hypothetical protein
LVDVIVTIIKKMKDEHDNSTEIFKILLSVYGYINSNSTAELELLLKESGVLNVEKYDAMDAKLLTATTKYYEQFSDEFDIKALDEHEISKLEVGAARAFSNIHLDKEIQYDDVASMFEKPSLPDETEMPPTQSNPLDLLSSAAEIQSASDILSPHGAIKRERSASKSPTTDTESSTESGSEFVPSKRLRASSSTRKRKLESSTEQLNKRIPNSRRSQKRSRSGSTSGESETEPARMPVSRNTRSRVQ